MIQIPRDKVTVTIVVQSEVPKPILEEGMIEIKFNVPIAKDGGTCAMSA